MWRYIHMQHHRFANDERRDPDYASSHAEGWRRPLRWLTLDLSYSRFYLPRLRERPRRERVELAATLLVFAGLAAGAIAAGWGLWFVALVLVLSRMLSLTLGWAFD